MLLNSGAFGFAYFVIIASVGALVLWARTEAARRVGTCVKCGYSLAGLTPDVCPECGAPTPRARE